MMASQQTGMSESDQDGWACGVYFSRWFASVIARWLAFHQACQLDGMIASSQPSTQDGKQNTVQSF
jgi:hypothetical protein